MTQKNNGQNPADLLHTANLLRGARPRISALRLDEIKRDVMSAEPGRTRQRGFSRPLRSRLLALSLFASLLAMSTSTAAAQALNWVSGGTLGKTLGLDGKTKGTSYFFGSYHWGGDKSDDAGHETYCRDDKGSDSDGKSSDGHHSGSYSKSGKSAKASTKSSFSKGSSGSHDSDSSSEGPCDSDSHSDSSDSSDRDNKYDKGGR